MDEIVKNERFDVYSYDRQNCQHLTLDAISELVHEDDSKKYCWVNINGLIPEMIHAVGKQYKLHELVLDDILHSAQRSKIDDYDDYVLITVKLPYHDEEQLTRIRLEQISFLVFPTMIISFQEHKSDVFNSVKKRLQKSSSRMRQSGIDYLLYTLFDNLIDRYMDIADQLSDQTDALESALIEQSETLSLNELYQVKRGMMTLRKSLQPLRDVLSYLLQENMSWIVEKNIPFYKDCYDHIVRTLDNLELQRDVIANILDVYLSTQNNRMNEVMKVMAVFATIFIPLTFITGIYGMNFEYLPGVKWHAGFYTVLSAMGLAVVGLVAYFKKKKWF